MNPVTVSIHQPNFMPWLKLVDKILASDVYVAYDTVQYTKTEYHARQKVKSVSGTVWLSVPVRHVRGVHQLIKDVRIDNSQPFRRKHLKMLRSTYERAPYFEELYPIVEDVYTRDQERLVDLNMDLIEAICSYLECPARIVRSSTLLPRDGDRTERVVELVNKAGGTEHLTSTYGADHQEMDWSRFLEAGIAIRSQRFEHPVYEQVGPGFVPHLAAIDMLFSCGRRTREILERNRRLVAVDLALAGTADG
jgi:hypothetical protein